MSESATTGGGARQGVALDFNLSVLFFLLLLLLCVLQAQARENTVGAAGRGAL